jgi:hypothetical protein
MFRVVRLNVVMLNVIILSVVMLSVVMLSVVMLRDVLQSVTVLWHHPWLSILIFLFMLPLFWNI